ncbi:MAG: T9SS type A sorting domain-containing protein, partial [Balneolaceae bacterium]
MKGFVYHSSDGGDTFSLLEEFNSLTRWLFINPANTDQLLLATGIFDREANTDDPDDEYASGSGLGVYRSEDGGTTWAQSNQGIDESKSMFIGGADRDPANPGTVIVAAGNNNDYNKGTFGAIYRSTDFGSTWTDVTPDLAYDAEPFTAVAFAPSDSTIVYVGSAEAIYRSIDNGLSWTRYGGKNGAPYGPPGIRSGVPIDMVVHPEDPDVVYVNNYGGGVFKSEDGGQNWVSWSKGYSGADIHSIAVDPNDPSKILANGRSGIFKSDDAGENWIGISYGYAAFPEGFGSVFDPADQTGKTLLCSDEHESYLLRSEDGGLNWTPVLYLETGEVGNRHGARTISFAPSNPKIVYAGFMAAGFHANPHELDFAESMGVYRSVDGGKNWQEINTGLPSGAQARNVTDIAISHQDPNLVYISLREGGIYKTTDGGQNWIDAKGTLPAGENWNDVWKEDDPIPRNSLLTVAVHPEDDQTIVIGCNSFGIYRSQNGGASWSQVLTPQRLIDEGTRDHGHITSIVIDPTEPSNIYAGEWHGGVYHSPDNGTSWNVINEMLSTRSVAMLRMSSEGEYLYAATQGEGVFRYQLKELGTSNDEVTLEVPTELNLNQNYPNPFNPNTTITYSIARSGFVTLSIFTTNGQKEMTLAQKREAAGNHTVVIDATSLPSGVY